MIIGATLAVSFIILMICEQAHRRHQIRVRIKRRLARLHWENGHPDPFELAIQIDAILWENRLDPTDHGISSLDALYALVEPAEKRYATWQRMKTSQK